MRFYCAVLSSIVAFSFTAPAGAEIKTVKYETWEDCLERSNGAARGVIAPAAAGRRTSSHPASN